MDDLDSEGGSVPSLVASETDDRWVADALANVVIPIGVAMASEADYDHLLERILIDAMSLSVADGGTLYLRVGDTLQFSIIRTTSLGIAMGGTSGRPVTFAPLSLGADPTTGISGGQSVSARAALTGQSVHVKDVYGAGASAYNFSGARRFDAANGYRTRSVLAIPLFDNASGAVSGVVQLINAGAGDGQVVPFAPAVRRVVESLCQLAGAALTNYVRQHRLKEQVRQLRIEIDEAKRDRQVQEISDSDYFKRLKSRSRELQQRVRDVGNTGGTTAARGDDNA